jgi:hypothetical protein
VVLRELYSLPEFVNILFIKQLFLHHFLYNIIKRNLLYGKQHATCEILTEQVDASGNASELHLGGAWADLWMGHWLF